MTKSQKIVIHAPAPLPQRTLAFFMDAIVVFFLSTVIISKIIIPLHYTEAMFYLKSILANFNSTNSLPDIIDQINGVKEIKHMLIAIDNLMFFITWMYFLLSELILKGTTLGKKIFNVKVISIHNLSTPTTFEIILRSGLFSVLLFSLWPILLLVNCAFIKLSPMRKSLHDTLSQTFVTK